MSLSWGFSVGTVRAREVSLLKKQDLDEMAACTSEQQLMTALSDKGFGGSDTGSLDSMLRTETEALWEYAKSTAADFSAFFPMLLDNDYHNLKTVIKGVLSGREYKHLFVSPSVVDTDTVETAVKEKRFSLLPDFMADDAAECYTLLAATSDAQLADGMLDKSRMKASLKAAENASEVLSEYIKLKVFYENIKVALRGAKASKDADYFKKTLYFPGKDDILRSVAVEGIDAVTEWLETCEKPAAESFKKSPSEFERYVDDRLMEVARKAKLKSAGADVLIGYVFAKTAEIRAVAMVASGIRTEAGEDVIRERLRELYD